MQGNEQIIRVIIVSFLIALFLGPVVIPVLKRLKVGQSIREDGPRSHLVKSGTPTMGGIIIILAILTSILTGKFFMSEVWAVIFFMLGFGVIGAIDDFIKVIMRQNEGLKPAQKIFGQLIFSVLLAWYGSKYSAMGTTLMIPFVNMHIDLGVLYIPFITFFAVGTVNAVNLTDGLDGPRQVEAKIRYQAPPAAATLMPLENGTKVVFHKPQRAITPGQAVVYYQGDYVLGGGTIVSVLKNGDAAV